MAFMQPDIHLCNYFRVETEIGSEFVPANLLPLHYPVDFVGRQMFDCDSPEWMQLLAAVKNYIEGKDVQDITAGHGYLGRLSASGYLDCTDWTPYDSFKEAVEGLKEMYGDDDEEAL